jgi:hypothetical protein
MKALLAIASATLVAGSAHADVIYSTFNSDEQDIFACCGEYLINNKGYDGSKFKNEVAIPFTPTVDARITEVHVALSYFSGTNDAEVSIRGSENQVPGRVKHVFHALDIPAAYQCCVYETFTAKGIPVRAGDTYWVVVKAGAHPFEGGWNFNSLGLVGVLAVNSDYGGGWVVSGDNVLTAVELIGNPMQRAPTN